MGLPLLAKVGEERELTEEISIYDIFYCYKRIIPQLNISRTSYSSQLP